MQTEQQPQQPKQKPLPRNCAKRNDHTNQVRGRPHMNEAKLSKKNLQEIRETITALLLFGQPGASLIVTLPGGVQFTLHSRFKENFKKAASTLGIVADIPEHQQIIDMAQMITHIEKTAKEKRAATPVKEAAAEANREATPSDSEATPGNAIQDSMHNPA